jgi:SAM-dependent methyltransferase
MGFRSSRTRLAGDAHPCSGQMTTEKHSESSSDAGVTILSAGDPHFEELYLLVRQKEGRIYSDSEVVRLPFASRQNPHRREWKLRAGTFIRFKEYLAGKAEGLRLLDLGCGYGWFSARLARDHRHTFCCMDVNLPELQQGARLFASKSVQFIRADIFDDRFSLAPFDLVVLNGSIQYFAEIPRLLTGLGRLLNSRGEIHILDSPFYDANELEAARQRTAQYYSALRVPEMSRWYHHHSLDELAGWRYELMAKPNLWSRMVARVLGKRQSLAGPVSPHSRRGGFPWIIVRAEQAAENSGTNQDLAAS